MAVLAISILTRNKRCPHCSSASPKDETWTLALEQPSTRVPMVLQVFLRRKMLSVLFVELVLGFFFFPLYFQGGKKLQLKTCWLRKRGKGRFMWFSSSFPPH